VREMPLDLQQHAHRRFNPLANRWVLVSPHRTDRPWQGQVEAPAPSPPPYDPACYMCPGNQRASGLRNPRYASTYVFDNDFPALSMHSPEGAQTTGDVLVANGARGRCRVVCYSPRHDLTMAQMEIPALLAVVECWAEQLSVLQTDPQIAHVQIFENRGAMMGASNPHPHGQIWATAFVPDEIAIEEAQQRRYADRHHSDLLGDYLVLEARLGERVVTHNAHFVCVVPFWAAWPFETLIIARRRVASLADLTTEARVGCSACRFPIRWGCTCGRERRPIRLSACTCTSSRRFCARRPCANSWLDSSCWRCRSAISRPNTPPNGCATPTQIERAPSLSALDHGDGEWIHSGRSAGMAGSVGGANARPAVASAICSSGNFGSRFA
jgi:UDPglucose--hexose-1-phosphate uridylyltransferase